MKYKDGDKVKIKNDLIVGKQYGIARFVSPMKDYLGKETKIEYDISDFDYYKLSVDKGCWLWTDEMLEDADETAPAVDGWISVNDYNPEDLPENKGKKVIKCLVAVKSRYPKGKPNIEKRQRQWFKDCNGEFVEWEWSRLRGETITHWMPMPKPPKED